MATFQSTAVQAWAVGDSGVVIDNVAGSWAVQTTGSSAKLNDIGARVQTYGTASIDLFVVGDGGTILRRLDATNTTTPTVWETIASGTTANLNDVSVIPFAVPITGGTAFAVGDGGIILKTVDQGATWTPQTSTTTNNLRAVSAPTALFAFAVGDGGVIVKTSDGGTTWAPVTSPTTTALKGVFFRDNKTGWVVGDGGKLYRTVNGGTSWVLATGTGTANLNSVWAMPFGNGYAQGCGVRRGW